MKQVPDAGDELRLIPDDDMVEDEKYDFVVLDDWPLTILSPEYSFWFPCSLQKGGGWVFSCSVPLPLDEDIGVDSPTLFASSSSTRGDEFSEAINKTLEIIVTITAPANCNCLLAPWTSERNDISVVVVCWLIS